MTVFQHVEVDAPLLHRQRSELLDSFAELEATVAELLAASGKPPSAVHLGLRLNDLRNLEPSCRLAKENVKQLSKIVDSIALLLPLRADIVHSRMQVCRIDSTPSARFVNAQAAGEQFPQCRLMTSTDLTRFQCQVIGITQQLKALNRKPSPASSPQPPSPGAAADP